jgi:hypothetical protein
VSRDCETGSYKIVCGVSSDQDCYYEVPSFTSIRLDENFLDYVGRLAASVVSLGKKEMVVDASAAEYFLDNQLKEMYRDIETTRLHVNGNEEFWWTGTIRHTSVNVETVHIHRCTV